MVKWEVQDAALEVTSSMLPGSCDICPSYDRTHAKAGHLSLFCDFFK